MEKLLGVFLPQIFEHYKTIFSANFLYSLNSIHTIEEQEQTS
jgi:hypothetical protein